MSNVIPAQHFLTRIKHFADLLSLAPGVNSTDNWNLLYDIDSMLQDVLETEGIDWIEVGNND